MKFPAAPLAAAILAGALCACSAPRTEGPGITRVKRYTLDPSQEPDTAEPAIQFEQKHYLHGAVSDADREARRGNYYTFFFRPFDGTTPVTARFEYRQQTTGFQVHAKQQTVSPRDGYVRFNVSGSDYAQRGSLLGWRVTLTQGGRVLGQRQSFLWE
jgi:hypothetical protein